MRFTETPLPGAYVLQPEGAHDARGFFARVWDAKDLADHGLRSVWVQSSISFNDKAGTLRGMHYQMAPHEEVKLVRCTSGAVFDVIVDLRNESSTFQEWFAIELTAQDNTTLYVPEGFAHGFLTLEDETVVEYHMSNDYHPESARGVRWDDPDIGIRWPSADRMILSDGDASLPTLQESAMFDGGEDPC